MSGRKVCLKANEASLLYSLLNDGGIQGMSMKEVRTMLPVMDKIGSFAEKKIVNDKEILNFKDGETVLKESELDLVIKKIDGVQGIMNMEIGRKVIALVARSVAISQSLG